jgi:oligopeptide/dipeptide ABC transporter ATP-binding protein
LHPYTQALEDAIAVPDPQHEKSRHAAGARMVQVLNEKVSRGCPYAPRCPLVEPACRDVAPLLVEKGDGHLVACHVAARAST